MNKTPKSKYIVRHGDYGIAAEQTIGVRQDSKVTKFHACNVRSGDIIESGNFANCVLAISRLESDFRPFDLDDGDTSERRAQ